MTELIQRLWILQVCFLQRLEDFLNPFLQNIDPSLLQNVVLGMLALLVPVGVGVLSFFFEERSRGKIESNLELFVLLKQVLKVKQIVLLSLSSLLLLSLYNLHFLLQIVAIIFSCFYLAWIVLIPFKNILEWFLKNTKGFALHFLKNLSVRRDERLLLDAWQALWLGNGPKENERDFTNIFITHIDGAIRYGKFDLAVQLAQIYKNNIEKRDNFSVGYDVLPKVFEWNEILWNEEQHWLKSYDTESKIQNLLSQKHFPTFRDWALKLYKKLNIKNEHFWNWNYFGNELLQTVIKILLKDSHHSSQLFSSFEKYIEESELKLNKIEDGEEKDKYWRYIFSLFSSFCPTLFNGIKSAPSSYGIWEHDFPDKWKITIANKDNRMSSIVLHEFLQWSENRIFKNGNEDKVDENLTEVMNGLFPNVHSSLFTAFLRLWISDNIKYALSKEHNFYILNSGVSWSSSVEESEEDVDKRINEMMRAQESSQREETIQLILNPNYFARYWGKLKITLDDSNKSEWENADSKKKELMLKNARKEKLEKIKTEIESSDVKEACKDSERKELYRRDLLELVELLILDVEK